VRFSTFRSDIYIPPFGEHVFGSAVESIVQRYLSAMQVSGDIINIIYIDRPMTPIGWTLIISIFHSQVSLLNVFWLSHVLALCTRNF